MILEAFLLGEPRGPGTGGLHGYHETRVSVPPVAAQNVKEAKQ
jgi:hypothetical protein